MSFRVAPTLAALFAVGCVSAARAPATENLEIAAATVCVRGTGNDYTEVQHACNILAADLAHRTAGRAPYRPPPCNDDDPRGCRTPESSLIVRLYLEYDVAHGEPQYADSIEVRGFGAAQASVDRVGLKSVRPWINTDDESWRIPIPLEPVERKQSKLSAETTTSVLKLASLLRNRPEATSWTICIVPETAGSDDGRGDRIVLATHQTRAVVQLYFGGEEQDYSRNLGTYGNAALIASAIATDQPLTPYHGDCRPD